MTSDDPRTTQDGYSHHPRGVSGRAGVSVTLLWHPDARRIGRAAPLGLDGRAGLSRLSPVFDDGEPLSDPLVSRTPLEIVPGPAGSVRLWPGRDGLRYTVDGVPGVGGETLDAAQLERGVTLGLGKGPILRLGAWPARGVEDTHGLVGASAALAVLRRAIDELGLRGRPVLVRGESGTGKELVAAALHAASPRARGPFVAVNLAALPASTAPSQLFGHARGAFTGADRAAEGYFGRAEGGTLFLDEIGACALEVQAQLLRALESREIQPIGAPVRRVDVRVIAATDEDLEQAVARGGFRGALLHRLARDEVRIPPLRERPEDIATLAVRFLGEELGSRAHRLGPPVEGAPPWLGADVVLALLARPWPGNVRELRAVCARLADAWGDADVCRPPPGAVPEAAPAAATGGADPDLAALLAAHDYRIGAVAEALGIGINTVRRRMEALDLPRPRDLDRDRIEAALTAAGTLEGAARALRVSSQGLKLRMTELGIDRSG